MWHLTTNYKNYICGIKCIYEEVLYEVNVICQKFALQSVVSFENCAFYKKLLLFIKNCKLHIYKKLKPLISGFITN